MASQDCISLAFRGEWKPFPTVHQSGRPKSAGALLGKTKSAVSLGLETNFEATISGLDSAGVTLLTDGGDGLFGRNPG